MTDLQQQTLRQLRLSVRKHWKAWLGLQQPAEAEISSAREAFWRDLLLRSSRLLGSVAPEHWGNLYEETLTAVESRLNGVYYTPAEIARRLARETLAPVLQSLSQSFETSSQEGEWRLASLKILDPACGCGIFLLAAAEILREGLQRYRPHAAPSSYFQCLIGWDLDPTALSLANHSLNAWANGYSNGTPETQPTLICQDGLLGLLEAPPDAHIILMNPPHLSEVRGQAGRFKTFATTPIYQAKMDFADVFLIAATEALAAGGRLGAVMPAYWIQRSGSAHLRQALHANGSLWYFERFEDWMPFGRALGQHPSLFVWHKSNKEVPSTLSVSISRPNGTEALSAGLWLPEGASGPWIIAPVEEADLLKHLQAVAPLRFSAASIQQGVVMPVGRLSERHWKQLAKPPSVGGLFLLSETELTQLEFSPPERAFCRPYYGPGDFQRCQGFPVLRVADFQLLYMDAEARQRLLSPAEAPAYSRLKRHLESLSGVNPSSNGPYGLHRPRKIHWFETDEPRLYVLRQACRPTAAVVRQTAYVNESFLIVKPETPEWKDFPEAWSALLNSPVAWIWLHRMKNKGARTQVDKDTLLSLPLPTDQPSTWWKALQNAAIQNNLPDQQALIAEAYQLNRGQKQTLEHLLAPLTRNKASSQKAAQF